MVSGPKAYTEQISNVSVGERLSHRAPDGITGDLNNQPRLPGSLFTGRNFN